MAHKNITDAELITRMTECAEKGGERWYVFRTRNRQSYYGFGTLKDAEAYTDYLNSRDDFNRYCELPIVYNEAVGLERGTDTDGFRLDKELQTIRDTKDQ